MNYSEVQLGIEESYVLTHTLTKIYMIFLRVMKITDRAEPCWLLHSKGYKNKVGPTGADFAKAKRGTSFGGLYFSVT